MAEYIEREAAIKELMNDAPEQVGYSREDAADCIRYMDAADVEPVVHRRWIEDHDYLKCPECSVMVKWDFTFFDIGNWNYCPNCGAKMDEKEDR